MLTCEDIVDGDYVARYVAGTLPASEVDVLEMHYLACDRCRTEVRLAAAVRAELPAPVDTASPVRSIASATSRNRLKVTAAAVLAVAATMVGVFSVRSTDGGIQPPPHRADALDADQAAVPQVPVGDVGAVEAFRWSPVEAADRYRVRLYGAEGTVIWETETTETVASPSGDADLASGTTYLWEVEARVGFDRWVSSDLVRFRVTDQ